MKERVTIRFGTNNVVLVAPHAHQLDDTNTNIIAQVAADALDAHAIINNGWRRSKVADELRSEANCNDIDHCQQSVVQAEFLDPIVQAIEGVIGGNELDPNENSRCYIFMIHGVGNSVRVKAKDPKLELIVGFGAGSKPFYTCKEWERNLFIDLAGQTYWNTYAGAPGGAYSARSKKNLTQAIFRELAQPVMQLEFVYALRDSDAKAKETGMFLANVIKLMMTHTSYTRPNGAAPPAEI